MPEATPQPMTLVTSPDVGLHFKRMTAHEEISRLFEFEVFALADDPAIKADDLLGTNAAVSIEVAEDTKRWFHGLVTEFGIDGVEGRFFRYRLVLRPWLWLLTRSADLRIFQDKTAPEIISEIFGEYTSTFVDETSGSYGTRTYCVQYRETDFNFVMRLMEEEGISFFFRHTDTKHEMVLVDAPGGFVASPGFEDVIYLEAEDELKQVDALHTWRMRHEIQTGKFTLSDYNFETPSTSLKSNTVADTRSHAEHVHEVYDYPGLYGAKADGDTRAQIRLDEQTGRHTRFQGEGNVPGLAAGCTFKLGNHPRDDQNAEYLVLSTRIEMQLAGYESGQEDTRFVCSLLAQKHADPFRPQRVTRKPAVGGPQTALVVGDADPGDILTDEHGRVKVQFHWDRVGEKKANSSCWLRVAMPSAGNGWGMFNLPRIGHEVVVSFLEGDPDQPLVIGSVFNAEVKTPYPLPDNPTVSTWKSRSKLGGAAEFNELRFEDKAGNEYVLFHAQKDRLEFVEETLRSSIGKDEHRTVKGKRMEKIEGTHDLHVVGAVKTQFDDKSSLTVKGDMLHKTDGNWHLKVASDMAADAGAKLSFKSGADGILKIGANLGVDAAQNVHIKGGMNIVIEGGMQVTIKAGGSSVVLGPDGVSITGTMVKINSGGSPGSGAGASPLSPTAPDAPEDPELPEDPLSHR